MANFPKAPPAIGRSVGLRGQNGAQGASGNGAVFTSVDSLQANPRSVSDWGPIINTAISAGTKHFVFGPFEYPFQTQIVVGTGIVFEGTSGWTHPTLGLPLPPSRLNWNGADGTIAVRALSADAFQMICMGLTYSSNTYNSTLFQVFNNGNQSGQGHIERCYIGGRATGGTVATGAFCLVDLRAAVGWTITRCSILYGQWGVRGFSTNDATGDNPDDDTIVNNIFGHFTRAPIGNPGTNWAIENNVFYMGGFGGTTPLPACVAEDHTATFNTTSKVTYRANRHWDFYRRQSVCVHQCPFSTWDFDGQDNWFYQFDGTCFQFDGPGQARVSNSWNTGHAPSKTTYPAVYLGNTTGQLIAPQILNATAQATGGTFAAGTYFYEVTAVNAAGETVASREASATVVLNGSVLLDWSYVDGATSYNLYRSTTTGAENVSPALVTTLAADAIMASTYTDTGTATTAGAVPGANTATMTVRAKKNIALVKSNNWQTPANTPALTTEGMAGHHQLDVSGNNYGDSITTIERERVSYTLPTSGGISGARAVPVIAVHAGATGVSAVSIYGSDVAGYIKIVSTGSSTGLLADVTFAQPPLVDTTFAGNLRSADGGLAIAPWPGVELTPTALATISTGPASVSCGAYVSVTSGTSTGFSIGVSTAIPGGTTVGFFYRVIQL